MLRMGIHEFPPSPKEGRMAGMMHHVYHVVDDDDDDDGRILVEGGQGLLPKRMFHETLME
jgi:hypothetical protein